MNVWCGDFFLLMLLLVLPVYVVNESLRRAASSTERRLTGACLRLPASAAFRCIWPARLPFYSSALHFIHFCPCTPERLSLLCVRSLSSLSLNLSLALSLTHLLFLLLPSLLSPPSLLFDRAVYALLSLSHSSTRFLPRVFRAFVTLCHFLNGDYYHT